VTASLEARQVGPDVGTQHRVARQVVGVVDGQVQRGVEGLLVVGGAEALLADRDVAAVAPRQPDVTAHLLVERQREELLRRGQQSVEERVVHPGSGDVEESDLAGRCADLSGDAFAVGALR